MTKAELRKVWISDSTLFVITRFIYRLFSSFPVGNYMCKVNNVQRNTRKRCEICSKLIKIPERRRRRSGVCTVNFEHISHLVLMFLLTLSR